ncbi:MAG: DUF11 domain-containing protein [Candidatus Methanoperedens sp.]|nr:DUF11 domain-containing protein [Candidatus Methanoperedens sp.]MCE8424223.1 DUF11 domain-containing protein [Candidatus Methanoperedens sp.]
MPVDAVKTDSFSMENYTGLNFMNGYYRIEIIQISKPSDMPFVVVNLTTDGLSEKYYIRENEDPSINKEPFNKINLNSSFITLTSARITVEYPETWSVPEKYTIEIPAIPEKIPDILVTKSADKITLNKGEVVEFKIIVNNTGNGTAYNLTLEDRFPPGFTSAPGSRFPPVIQNELMAGEHLELLFALKAVEPGSYNIEPTTLKYGTKIALSNSLSITVLEERSHLLTVITLDKDNIFTDDVVKVAVKITNKGNISAESILIDGTPPEGINVIEGDLRKGIKNIEPGESEEYFASLKAVKAGNYTINLTTSYSDDSTGFSSSSNIITVTEREKNYLYILVPLIIIIAGIVLFIMRRHREYSF